MNKLLKVSGALPFLLAVFLNAFVDLGHKIVIQNTIFKIYDGQEQIILTAIVNGLILLPFILLFSPAGFVSDRFPKNQVMRMSAWAAVVLTLGITACYALGWFWLSFAMTFLLAVQSALYSPAKYGYLKGFFGKQHLAEANGIVQAISIVAILAGTLLMSVLFEAWYPEGNADKGVVLQQLVPIGMLLVAASLLEVVMMYRLPKVDEGDATQQFDTRAFVQGRLFKSNLQPVLSRDAIRLSIIGLAMFWSIGQVMLASFPAFAKEQMGETNTLVIQAIIAATGLGIALGSATASRLSRNYIETGLVPLGAAGIGLGLWLLPTLESPWTMGLDFLLIGTMGGLFIVPLNALIQFHAGDNEMGRVLAANNLIQNIGMLSFLVVTALFAVFGISSKQLLLLTAVFAVLGGCYTVYKLPQSLVRFLLTYLMSRHYRINVQGMNHVPESGGVLLLGNHISWIDWAIVQIAYPRPVKFVMLKSIYERWYLKWFFKLFGCVPIESGASAQQSLEQVADLLNEGKVVCLFPEGTISRTGHLAEFRRGYERAAEAANADVVIQPFYLRGLWGSQFSRSSDKLKHLRSTPGGRDLVVSFGRPIDRLTPAEVLKRKVFELSIDSWQDYVATLPTLPEAWINTCKEQRAELAVADVKGQSQSGLEALSRAQWLSKQVLQNNSAKNVALLMPASTSAAITHMAVLMCGKTAVTLDPSLTPSQLQQALEKARVQTIYTSAAKAPELQATLEQASSGYPSPVIIEIDSLLAQQPLKDLRRRMLTNRLLPSSAIQWLSCRKQSAQRTAAILFRADEQGVYGAKFSHANLMANLKQMSDVLNSEDQDVMLATEPWHECAGLTLQLYMPLVEGIPLVCPVADAEPLDLAKTIARYRITLLCSQGAQLQGFLDEPKVHPLMLDSLRRVVALGYREHEELDKQYRLRFGKPVLDAYCASATAPVTSINLPDAMDFGDWKVQLGGKPGAMGMPLPGSSFKVVDPLSLEELPCNSVGLVLMGGVQLTQGVLGDQSNSATLSLDDGLWQPTDQQGRMDADGFLWIEALAETSDADAASA
ncbi:MFS transporter [Pseudomaricurvus alkylphenolicus]|uniref:MFS transporter n=1 Tax=Pseudomaricurvus alkylphenolicus TaxID=1306991 RepID=UPI00141D74C1|nr:MFS transporter [Pseudomaricurvus alkylphenolicus]NIB39064.1 MFS transporter [Pseudomaricurvus alkylphenolicus]